MTILKYLLLIIEVVCSFLLVVVILLQKTKSQGLGMAFGAGMGETLFGSRAGNVLSKITIGLGITFLVCTLFLGMIFANAHEARQQGRGLMGGSAAAPVQRAKPAVPASPAAPVQPAQPAPVAAPAAAAPATPAAAAVPAPAPAK